MKAMNLLSKLVKDEQGGEVLEYAPDRRFDRCCSDRGYHLGWDQGPRPQVDVAERFHVISHHAPGPRGSRSWGVLVPAFGG